MAGDSFFIPMKEANLFMFMLKREIWNVSIGFL